MDSDEVLICGLPYYFVQVLRGGTTLFNITYYSAQREQREQREQDRFRSGHLGGHDGIAQDGRITGIGGKIQAVKRHCGRWAVGLEFGLDWTGQDRTGRQDGDGFLHPLDTARSVYIQNEG